MKKCNRSRVFKKSCFLGKICIICPFPCGFFGKMGHFRAFFDVKNGIFYPVNGYDFLYIHILT